ncbi:MAG: glycosyltransferase family 2 protein [Clostridium sp.]
MEPKVSIIVPVYNCEKYIIKCLNSILNQSYKNIEVIVINDGSYDESEKKVRELEGKDIRIRYFKQDNSGPSKARNNGIGKASGKYLMFVDADDNIDVKYVEKLLNKIEFKNYDLVSCGYIDESRYGVSNQNDFWFGTENLEKKTFIASAINGVGGTLWGKIFRRDLILENNIEINNEVYMCEDLLFVLEYCLYSEKFGAIKDNLYKYNRLNENSISTNLSFSYLDNNIFVIKEIEKYLIKLKVDKKTIQDIIVQRVQSLTNTIIINEVNKSIKHNNYDTTKKNIKMLIGNEFINKYKRKFSNKNLIIRLTNKFIMNNNETMLMYLYILIQRSRNIKNRILRI